MMVVFALMLAVGADDFGRIVTLSGKAVAVADNMERALAPGSTVSKGETLRTDAKSQVQLLLADKTVISIGPSAQVVLASLDRTEQRPKLSVKLVVGRLWARIQSAMGTEAAFSVQTTNAVAGVRGTSLVVEFDPQQVETRVLVDRGLVDVRNQQGMGDNAPENTQAVIHGDETPVFSQIEGETLSLVLGSFENGVSLGDKDTDKRLNDLQDDLGGTSGAAGGTPPANEGGTPPIVPVELDPQQTNRDAIIRGRVEIVE